MRLCQLLIPTVCALAAPSSQADCSFTSGPGDDAHVCDAGIAPELVDTDGNNSLSLPVGGSGSILGNVTFGAGTDRIDMASGSIGGNVNQGAGVDEFSMSGGEIEGNLNQGDGLDRFFMTGGWIKGTFDSGDYAEMDGGRIGNVNMRLDRNTFIMRGGSIDRNLITGFDEDYVEVFAGTIGGNISVSGGDDQVLLHGGQVGGDILLSLGNDRFTWDGGEIGGQVELGPGDDGAWVRGLSTPLVTVLDGGEGDDSLTFDASQPVGGALYRQWERIALVNASRLGLDDALVLGGSGTAGGALSIDASSTLVSRSGEVRPFADAGRATLVNAGRIDLGSGADAQGRLTVHGDYLGDGGTLRLGSVLAGDGAPSDRLVVSRGHIGGTTFLHVNNLGGRGAASAGNGIQVVEAYAGATSDANAFVQAHVISAGAYDYRLFRGGVEAASENDWYLRSSLVGAESGVATPQAAAAPGQASLPEPVAGQRLPLYRPEVPVYAAAPRGASILVRQALGTFHQRQGDQRLLRGQASLPAAWGQAYGGAVRQHYSGTVSPRLDGNLSGFKVGQDLHARVTDGGYRHHAGVYLAQGRLNADVNGFALAREDRAVGDLKLHAASVGAYWTLVGPQGAYLDALLQYSDLEGRARSHRGDKLDLDGHAWAASLEAGYPIALSPRWTLEPQTQVIAQKVSLDSAHDSVSRVTHAAQVEFTGRLGARLEGAFSNDAGHRLQPFAQLNLWQGDGGRDSVTFDAMDRIKTDYRYTSVQLEAGLLAQMTDGLSLHGAVQYSTHLDSRQQESSGVNVGVRWQF